MNQVAFEAAKKAANLAKQIQLNEAMIAQREAQIAEMTEDLNGAHHVIDQAWNQIDQLSDKTEINKNAIRNLKIKLRSHKRRIVTINQRLVTANIALADQKKLTDMVVERQKMKGITERNIGISSGSGLLTAIFGSILISPYVAIPAASLCTGIMLSDSESTRAHERYNELSIDINTLCAKLERVTAEDEQIEDTQAPLLDPTIQRNQDNSLAALTQRLNQIRQRARANPIPARNKTMEELVGLNRPTLAEVVQLPQARETATIEEISDEDAEEAFIPAKKDDYLNSIMKMTAETRARQQTPEFKARMAEIKKRFLAQK